MTRVARNGTVTRKTTNGVSSRGEVIAQEGQISRSAGIPVNRVTSEVAEMLAKSSTSTNEAGVTTVPRFPPRGNTSEEGVTKEKIVVPRVLDPDRVRVNADGSKTIFSVGGRISRSGHPIDQAISTAPRIFSSSPLTQRQLEQDVVKNPQLYQQPMGVVQSGGFQMPWVLIIVIAGVLVLFNILSKRKK